MMVRTRFLRVIFSLLLLSLWARLPLQAAAHGSGTLQLASAHAGPYLVTVWISPSPVRAGRPLHVTVAVSTAVDANDPVLDADVAVSVVPQGSSKPLLTTKATTAQSVNKLLYEADMSVTDAGIYLIDISVEGSAGVGKTVFALEVMPEANTNWLVIALLIGGAALALLFFWRWKRGSRAEISLK